MDNFKIKENQQYNRLMIKKKKGHSQFRKLDKINNLKKIQVLLDVLGKSVCGPEVF
jgi:hypothetical protein